MTTPSTADEIIAQGAVAVVRLGAGALLRETVAALLEGGISAVELTLTTPGAIEAIAALAAEHGDAVCLGAGSVLEAEQAERAVDAGACFVVSPVLKPDVVHATMRRGALAIPGAFTPTEILAATELGAGIVKVFPADILGMRFFAAVRAPMPRLRLMPTGGVTIENAADWLRAGACAVGIGSALVDPALVAAGRFEEIARRARALAEAVRGARG